MTLENAGFRWSIRMKFGNRFFAFECGDEATIATLVAQEWKDIAHAFAKHCFATKAGDALHRAIPRDDATVAIEREHTIDTRVDYPVVQIGVDQWLTFL